MKATLQQLFAYLKSYRLLLIIAIILASMSAVFAVITPDFLSEITTEIQAGLIGDINIDTILKLTFTAALLVLGSMIFGFIQNFMMATISQRTSQRLRSDINTKIDKIPLAYFDQTTYGETLSRVTNDVDTLATALNNSIGPLISSVIMIIGTLFMMFYTNWMMAIAGLSATVLGFVLTGLIMKKSQPFFLAQQKELGELNGQIEEVLTGQTVVKAYNNEANVRATFHAKNTDLYESGWKAQFLSGLMMPIMGFISNFGYVVVCITGAALVLNGSIEIGVIVAFMLYVRLFMNPLGTMAQAFGALQPATAAGERIFTLLNEPELVDESQKIKHLTNVTGDVTFTNVNFSYNAERTIINNFSAHVESGQKVAIVGPTGAGKTTLVNLLMRFYELNKGTIAIDGVPLADLTRENVHELFGMVLQDTWVFEGTVRENIVYATPNVSDAQLKAVCKEVGLYHFIKTLPHGFDTILDEKTALSAGQKQLITIARAMIENAPLLILDEATSSIDTRTEKIIQNAIDTLTSGRTSFVIAHRLSTIKNADVIFVMKDGDIIETGSHDELIAAKGFYCDLYNSQFDTSE
ncbi:MAG: ABC transporter ATP-binding protein [Culicoidibacterales bacterium]